MYVWDPFDVRFRGKYLFIHLRGRNRDSVHAMQVLSLVPPVPPMCIYLFHICKLGQAGSPALSQANLPPPCVHRSAFVQPHRIWKFEKTTCPL